MSTVKGRGGSGRRRFTMIQFNAGALHPDAPTPLISVGLLRSAAERRPWRGMRTC
jgi:hypothetical protein